MCAETVPWRCHRSLIADALTVRGVKVEHIISEPSLQEHRLTPFARVEGAADHLSGGRIAGRHKL